MQDAVAASPTISSVWGIGEMPIEDLNNIYANEESQWMDVNGMRIHYRDEGDPNGQPIVLIHGILSSLHTWEQWNLGLTNKGLADTYRIISLDVPGFGLTGGPENPDDFSESLLHDSFSQFISQLQLDDFILAGNSLGGYISAHYAANNPGKVKKLILIDPAGAPQDLPFILSLASTPGINSLAANVFPPFIVAMGVKDVYGDQERITKANMDRYIHLSLRPGAKQAYANTIAMLDDKNSKQAPLNFASITAPTLLMWGEKDIWVPATLSEQWLKNIPGSTLITYPDAGHVPMEEIPQQTLQDALSFINLK
ncbi:alpha/beta hydrolase [Moritella marina ATCC 15381]|uniref:Alpha/beta hydrolase n=1 Tax=Moritella marina ATCC 15381 TaxID=1202962 RepID=A0A5J6WLK5_MORMI|nr:alpha/beta hydrolase [Moritella marina]QFI38927.1 alpha/beta hydrolase [Moritella marina ATCC 15381]